MLVSSSAKWPSLLSCLYFFHRLAGLVVKTSVSGVKDPGFESCWRWDFSWSSHTSDLKIGTPVATLPGAWYDRVRALTGRPSVSILLLGEVEIGSATSILVWQHIELSVQIRPWDILACCWEVKEPTNKQPFSTLCSAFLHFVISLFSS